MEIFNASKLRENIYQLLDQAIKTGKPIAVQRRGVMLKIVPPQPKSKLKNLKKIKNFVVGDPEDLVHIDWENEWRPESF